MIFCNIDLFWLALFAPILVKLVIKVGLWKDSFDTAYAWVAF